MKRENLYLVGGALLASTALTALTSVANAGTFALKGDLRGNVGPSLGVSAQIFGSTPATSTTLGPIGLVYRFNQNLSTVGMNFNATIGVTGAQFNTAGVTTGINDVKAFVGTVASTGSINLSDTAASITCSIVPTTTQLLITNCSVTASTGTGSITGFIISGVTFDNATGLATAGGTIALTATINLLTGGTVLFETTASQAVVTSRSSLTTTVTATSASTIDVNSSPAFTRLANGSLTVSIATINVTHTGALAGDLTTVITGTTTAGVSGAATGAANFIRLNSTILADDAIASAQLTSATAASIVSRTATSFGSGFVTFTLASSAAIQDPFNVVINFNGTGQIDAGSVSTVDVSYAAIAAASATANNAAPTGVTGVTAASLSRNGLSINVNGIQPSVAQGARTYTSLLRIVNNGAVDGTVSVSVRNSATGVVLGTYTSPSIPGNSAIQVSSAALETGAGITPTASVLYQATITGSITGYVQHVNWNQDAGFFTDLSGRRSSSNGVN